MSRPAIAVLLLLCLGAPPRADDMPSLAGLARGSLTISTASARQHHFDIWLALTPQQQQRGLMFVKELAADQGMLFVQEPPRVMNMWMKNTLIPLDMLFIDVDGRILYIKNRAQPQSLSLIGYDRPVRGVLELRGGEAAARGIREGDRVASPYFSGPPTP